MAILRKETLKTTVTDKQIKERLDSIPFTNQKKADRLKVRSEVEEFANMPCVFYLGEIGKKNMGYTKNEFIPPLNHDLKGSSSWLKEI